MPSRKDPTSQRLFDLFEQTRLVNRRKVFEALLSQPGKNFDQVFNFEDDRVYLIVARIAFRLGASARDAPLLRAFDAAGLDHRNPMDWQTLLSCFAEAHFGNKKTKPVKWNSLYLNEVFRDYSEVKLSNPGLSDEEICKLLRKDRDKRYKGRYDGNLHALRKLVRFAKNPEHNVFLRYPGKGDSLVQLMRGEFETGGTEWDERFEEWAKTVVAADYFKVYETEDEDNPLREDNGAAKSRNR